MAALVKRGLEEGGYSVDVAADATDGFWLASENQYDAIVLDVVLSSEPDAEDGFDVCRRLREAGFDLRPPLQPRVGRVRITPDRVEPAERGIGRVAALAVDLRQFGPALADAPDRIPPEEFPFQFRSPRDALRAGERDPQGCALPVGQLRLAVIGERFGLILRVFRFREESAGPVGEPRPHELRQG